jgi:ATP-dependent Clp protease ATP-binding subunit ClpA
LKVLFINVSDAAKQELIREGYDPKYNGRNIRRVIEQRIEIPIAKIIASDIMKDKDNVMIDFKGEYVFSI